MSITLQQSLLTYFSSRIDMDLSRLIFLGTAGSINAISRSSRSSGGFVLQVGTTQIQVDPGPGALIKAREYNINHAQTTAILVSHNHLNHCNDLNVIIEAMTHSGLDRRGLLLASKSVILPSENHHPFLTQHHQNFIEKIIPLEKNHKVGLENMEIHAISAEHTDSTAVGFKFICPKFTLGYSGDTTVTQQLMEELNGCDVLILNVPYPGNTSKDMNLDTEQAVKIVSFVRPKIAFLTHFGVEMLRVGPLDESREIQRITGIECIAARDGLTVVPESYRDLKPMVRGF